MLKGVLGLPATAKVAAVKKEPDAMDEEDEPMEIDPLQEDIPKGSMEDEMDLEEPEQQGGRNATMDDDDEDMPAGAERVQCASQ